MSIAGITRRMMRLVRRESQQRRIAHAPSASDPRVMDFCARLTSALKRAIRDHRPLRVERLSHAAGRVAHLSASLTEQTAQWKLSQHQPQAAMERIECCRQRSTELSYLHALCLLQLGRTVEAHMHLREMLRAHPQHRSAQTLLGLLNLEAGDAAAAIADLAPLTNRTALQLLTLANSIRGQRINASVTGRTLLRDHSLTIRQRAVNTDLLQCLGLREGLSGVAAPPIDAGVLASELAEAERFIPVVSAAAQLKQDSAHMQTLRDAVVRALPRLIDPVAAYTAIIELSLGLNECETALRWSRQAMDMHLGSAALALLHEQCVDAVHLREDREDNDSIIGRIRPIDGEASTRGKAA